MTSSSHFATVSVCAWNRRASALKGMVSHFSFLFPVFLSFPLFPSLSPFLSLGFLCLFSLFSYFRMPCLPKGAFEVSHTEESQMKRGHIRAFPPSSYTTKSWDPIPVPEPAGHDDLQQSVFSSCVCTIFCLEVNSSSSEKFTCGWLHEFAREGLYSSVQHSCSRQ